MEITRLVVVYATTEGHTQRIAWRIADVAGSLPGVDASVEDVKQISLAHFEGCDAVVLAASVHYGHHQRSMLRFVRKYRKLLAKKRTAFVSVSGASATPAGAKEARDYVSSFIRKTEWHPDRVELVAGATLFTRYNPLLRFVMRRIAASKGMDTDTRRDFDYTDWDRVEQFARSFAAPAGAVKVA